MRSDAGEIASLAFDLLAMTNCMFFKGGEVLSSRGECAINPPVELFFGGTIPDRVSI
jgi:hypothetical protein